MERMKKELNDQIQNVSKRFESIEPGLHLDEKQKELQSLDLLMQSDGFWNDQKKAEKKTRQRAFLEKYIHSWGGIRKNIQELSELIEQSNEEEAKILEEEIDLLINNFEQKEGELLLSEEHDSGNAILSLYVGTGGQDAEDFCQMLFRMYNRYAEQKGWKVHILDESYSDDGLKSATLQIEGEYVYGKLASEHGVHRLIRLSPFNAKNLRQTSFARVEVLPEIEEDEIEIHDKDIRIDVFRASGNGGQSVNTTDSAVRITYMPLNIVVTCQNEKSQLQNKESALKVLRARLMRHQLDEQEKKKKALKGVVLENSFGSQIRTYTLQPYKLVKDHRTDIEHQNPDKVLAGDLDLFVEGYLRYRMED